MLPGHRLWVPNLPDMPTPCCQYQPVATQNSVVPVSGRQMATSHIAPDLLNRLVSQVYINWSSSWPHPFSGQYKHAQNIWCIFKPGKTTSKVTIDGVGQELETTDIRHKGTENNDWQLANQSPLAANRRRKRDKMRLCNHSA